ncbi:L-fucose:H+ symporter permease [Tellurirhabdus rosea]|uniref:L-fucose:H+ symporter permease n=1 Tax=Tellurirhabdus rosea TaxID=2674997 RepID=UPI0022579E2E|nr:L-fucose:H+ symporter permease [Tellurirhabdus rosea]
MASISPSTTSVKATAPAGNVRLAFALVTSLFFLWGFAISMLDGLNKKVQNVLHVSRAESAWVQVVTFGAYFLMALPAGYFMKRYGYKKGILFGLLLYAAGGFLVYPAGEAQSWQFFLIALFILACGLAFLETAANPYVSVLGTPETSEQRLNLAQSFNGLGAITGPLVGGFLLFANTANESVEEGFDSIQLPYLVVGGLVLLVALIFYRTPLPEIQEETLVTDAQSHSGKTLFQHAHFRAGVLAQFLNVGAQGCVWGFFINYATELSNLTDQKASYLLSVGMVIFMIGRFAGTFLMRYVKPNVLLGWYSVAIVALLIIVSLHLGQVSLYALLGFFFFQSITFPTIFALGVKDLGQYTKQGSSYIIMGIVGGAVFPPVMGWIADNSSIANSFLLPALFFAVIGWFGFKGSQVK